MLRIVERALDELGLVQSSTTLKYYINITTGDSLSISAFVDDRRFLQIKASEFVNLQAQYDSNCRAWNDHPSFMPKPLAYRACDGWTIMVSEGVSHSLVRRTDVIPVPWRRHGLLTPQLWAFFSGGARSVGEPETDTLRALLSTVQAHFANGPLASMAADCIESAVAASVESLAPRPQHGDFVFTNLGRVGRRLVIFDWEDYGKVELPGLDLFTLTMWLFDEDPRALSSLMDSRLQLETAIESFLGPACKAQGVELSQFRRLAPLYLLVFLYLKRTYGSRIQQRMTVLLDTLVSTGRSKVQGHPMKTAPGRS